ncbi:MAG: type VI secretion system baseplate subunit TssG [Polyangiaceae bacterium]|nr:type VI secretion system baseplate subunit TssG [Polyangiaceae bacterium]
MNPLEQASRIPFFALVRLLEHWLETDIDESDAVAFAQVVELAFPISDVAEMDTNAARHSTLVTLRCLGLTGVASPMAPEWTEGIVRQDDHGALRAFCNVFADRAARVLYAIWKARALEGGFDLEGRDALSERLRAVVGVDAWAPDEQKPMPPMVALGLADYRRGQPQTIDKESAERLLRYLYPTWNVSLETNVQRIVPLHPEERSRLGEQRHRLGLDAFCGGEAKDEEDLVRIHVGPLEAETYHSLMPGQPAHTMLSGLVRQLFSVNAELEIQVSQADAPPCQLGAELGTKLGLDTYCTSRTSRTSCTSPRDEMLRVRVPLTPTAVIRTFVF